MQTNLKLAVISELMEKDLLVFDDSAFPREGKARATSVLAHFKKLTIAPDLLARVERLNPDGGDVVYQAIFGGCTNCCFRLAAIAPGRENGCYADCARDLGLCLGGKPGGASECWPGQGRNR